MTIERSSDQIAAVTKDETFAVIEATPKEIRIYSSTGVADMIFNDIKLPKAPGRPEPDGWGGKVTSLEGLSSLNPDHLILLFESENNVLEDSKLWEGLKAVQSGNVYRMTSRQSITRRLQPGTRRPCWSKLQAPYCRSRNHNCLELRIKRGERKWVNPQL